MRRIGSGLLLHRQQGASGPKRMSILRTGPWHSGPGGPSASTCVTGPCGERSAGACGREPWTRTGWSSCGFGSWTGSECSSRQGELASGGSEDLAEPRVGPQRGRQIAPSAPRDGLHFRLVKGPHDSCGLAGVRHFCCGDRARHCSRKRGVGCDERGTCPIALYGGTIRCVATSLCDRMRVLRDSGCWAREPQVPIGPGSCAGVGSRSCLVVE